MVRLDEAERVQVVGDGIVRSVFKVCRLSSVGDSAQCESWRAAHLLNYRQKYFPGPWWRFRITCQVWSMWFCVGWSSQWKCGYFLSGACLLRRRARQGSCGSAPTSHNKPHMTEAAGNLIQHTLMQSRHRHHPAVRSVAVWHFVLFSLALPSLNHGAGTGAVDPPGSAVAVRRRFIVSSVFFFFS